MTTDNDDSPPPATTAGAAQTAIAPTTALAVVAEATGATIVTGEYRGWTDRLLIAGTTGLQYTVSRRVSDGVWGCSCPGWIFNRRCQHLDAMLPHLLKAFPGSQASPPLQRVSAPVRGSAAALAAPPRTEDERIRHLVALALQAPPGETKEQMVARIQKNLENDRLEQEQARARALAVPQGAAAPPPGPDRRAAAEARRRERIRRITSGEAYKRVAPGSVEGWTQAAAAFARGDATFIPDARAYQPKAFTAKPKHSPVLAALFLEEVPTDLAALRRDYRHAVMRIFREAEFNDTAPAYVAGFARVTAAFEALKAAKRWA